MLRVKIQRVGQGIATASSLLVATGQGALSMGCTAEVTGEGDELVGESESAIVAGSGTFDLSGWPGYLSMTLGQSSTDEFVRAGESLDFRLPAWLLWETLYPNDPVPDGTTAAGQARLEQLAATVDVRCYDQATLASTVSAASNGWTTVSAGDLRATTASVTVPAGTDTIRFQITVTDAANPGASATIDESALGSVAVFGGELPSKSILFDTNASTYRNRTIEGDDPVAGANITLGYTDWRADTLVDRSSINTQIGEAQGWGRFGPYTTPIYGKIVHEVSYGVYFDDGGGWRSEEPLTTNTASRFLGSGRTGYDKQIGVPASATHMSLYFHVKTYVVADYTGYNVTSKWYGDGQWVLMREKWDNPYGAYTNFEFNVQP